MLKIFEEQKKDEDVYLRLIDKGDIITLAAYNKNGEKLLGGNLFDIIKGNGHVVLYSSVDVAGIETDEEGRLIIEF